MATLRYEIYFIVYEDLKYHWCVSIHLLSQLYSRLLLVKLSVVQLFSRS